MNKKDRKIIKNLEKKAKARRKEFYNSLYRMTPDQINDPNHKWMEINRIVVNSEQAKEQLLKASKYIHDLRNLDTNIHMVNIIAHLYCRPELIIIEEKEK